MLSKDKRLNLRHVFKAIASASKLETPNLKFFYKLGQNENPLVGISLSKKYFKKAHDRNRARRVSSRAIEQIYNNLPSSINLVIMPKTGVLEQSEESLIKEVADVIRTIKVN